MTIEERNREKELYRRHRNGNSSCKGKEKIKAAHHQHIVDDFKKKMKKKGVGRNKKIKGEVMPTMIIADNCVKGWTHVGFKESGYTLKNESMASAIIFYIT